MANLQINKVIIGGRLTAPPELKQTPQGVAVTSFTVAIGRKGKRDETDFINCVAWRQTAELVCNYFGKGSCICLAGSIQVRSWDDKNGGKRYATEVVAEEVYFVDSKTESDSGYKDTPKAQNTPYGGKMASAKFEELAEDEDLPF